MHLSRQPIPKRFDFPLGDGAGRAEEYESRKRESLAGTKAAMASTDKHTGRWLIATAVLGIAYFVAYSYSPGLMRLIGIAFVICGFYRTQNP